MEPMLSISPWPQPRSVYVAFEVFPRPKGSTSHIAAMITALARRHSPVWLLCCGQGEMPTVQCEGDIVIHRHKSHEANMLKRAMEFGDFVFHKLSRLHRSPELCVFRDPWSGCPSLHALPSTPAIFEVNGLPSWELSYRYPAVVTNAALRAKIEDMERFCLEGSQRVLTVSDLTGKALGELGVEATRISVVPNSSADDFFFPEVDACPLDVLKEGRWFGYIGGLHRWQGVHLLVRAWSEIAEEWPDVRLLIIHGRQTAALKSLKMTIRKSGMAERVVLSSPLPPHQLAGAITRMEFTCAPLTETLRNTVQGCCPVKIVESMAAGTPVLASNLRVARALIRHGKDGYLVPPGDVRQWAPAIRHLLADSELLTRLSQGAKQTALKRMTRGRMFEALDSLFEMAGRKVEEASSDGKGTGRASLLEKTRSSG